MNVSEGVSGFPTHRIHPDRELYRIHKASRSPLWFATTDVPGQGGRFDLSSDGPAGTCYLATSAVGAFLEKFARFGAVTREIIDNHRLTYLAAVTPLELADLTDRTVLGDFGVTGDVSTGTDYGPSQALASRLWNVGLDGIFYAARHDPSFSERSVAVFGMAGETADEATKRFDTVTVPIPQEVIDAVQDDFHLYVMPSTPLADADVDSGRNWHV